MITADSTSRALRLLALAALLLTLPLAAAADEIIYRDAKGLPLWEKATWTDAPVRIVLPDHEALDALLDRVPIKSFDRDQIDLVYTDPKHFHLVFEPRVTGAEKAALIDAGYDLIEIPDLDRIGREQTEARWLAEAQGKAYDSQSKLTYPTNAQIGSDLTALANTYPGICRVFTWGQSVQGRDLWGIVISDDVQNTEPEPEVRISSTMHGDEVVGMVMLHEMAHYLTQNYGQPGYDEVTDLVNSTEIVFIPLHNPDGNALGQRYNANSVDLNRNYPEPAGTHSTQEVENVHMMNFLSNNHFVLGGNMHGGALVFNYLWDYTYTLAPDDAACIELALSYSTTNLPMYNGSFPQGITNGADWYVATGTLQDWTYDQTDGIGATLELSNTKWPAESTLDGFWDDNRQSILNYIGAVHNGIHGVVTGSDTGLPLDAEITVTGNAKTVHTDPSHGDYYKILPTGTWQITVTAAGYIPQTISGISTVWGSPTIQDIVLDPVAHGDVAGNVASLTGTPLSATVRFYSLPVGNLVDVATTDASGDYTASLVYGDYRVEASATGYITGEETVTVGAAPAVADFQLTQAVEVVLFSDDFEGALSGWSGGWGITSPADGYLSANSLNDSPGGNYADNASNSVQLASGLDLSGSMSGTVGFWAHWEIENTWDAAYFEISTNGGGSWTALSTAHTQSSSGQGGQSPGGVPCFDNSQAGWVYNSVDLAAYLNETDVRFRFRLSSDTSIHYSGFFVDDFEVMVVQEQSGPTPVPQVPDFAASVSSAPNPFNPMTTVSFRVPQDGPATLQVFDVQGRLVRTLADERLARGDHERTWDGSTDGGRRAASGAYFVLLRAGEHSAVQKVSLIK